MAVADAEQLLRDGDPVGALARLQEAVKAKPADVKARIFLFQLLCVLGQWERALNQLATATSLDDGTLAMAQMYGEAVRCEAIRREVFAGRTAPMVFGHPEQWLALLIESLLVSGQGDERKSESLRLRAFEEAEVSSGVLNDRPFDWVADADSRIGPVLEAIINGRYYWVPLSRLSQMTMEAPTDLRDVVWMPAQLQFENGGETVALIPTRYPGSETSSDGLIQLSRKTEWDEVRPGCHVGRGQRVLSTDRDEVALMDVRTLTVSRPTTEAAASG